LGRWKVNWWVGERKEEEEEDEGREAHIWGVGD
jgi:hypothetical protein